MLTKETVIVAAGVIIESLAETPGKEAPESFVYLALNTAGYQLDEFYKIVELIVELMIASKMVVRIAGPQLKLAPKGESLAADMASIREGARA